MRTITAQRIKESKLSTISKFSTDDGSITGYFMEPPAGVRIPAGTYALRLHGDGERWNAKTFPPVGVLEVVDVPGREAILIHPGNYPRDTHGCLLPGQSYGPEYVSNSRAMTARLVQYIGESGQIVIKNLIFIP